MKTINYLFVLAFVVTIGIITIYFVKQNKTNTSSLLETTNNNFTKVEENKTQPEIVPLSSVYEEKKLGVIKVHLPSDANVLINDKATYSLGPYRVYDSELVVGKNYNFKIAVSYKSGTSEIREIKLTGGQTIEMNFSE